MIMYLSKYLYTLVKNKNIEKFTFYTKEIKFDSEIKRLSKYKSIVKAGREVIFYIEPFELSNTLLEMKSYVIKKLEDKDLSNINYNYIYNILKEKFSNVENFDYLAYITINETIGYGPFSILLEEKDNIEEIKVNGISNAIQVYIPKYGFCNTNLYFYDINGFKRNINKLVFDSPFSINDDTPILDAYINDIRVHAQIKPFAIRGAIASIRLHNKEKININKLLEIRSIDPLILSYLLFAIRSGSSIIIAGPPASGKTTLLRSLLELIPNFINVVIIEDSTNELDIDRNFSSLLASKRLGQDISFQITNALRLRPNLIAIGEIRGSEAKEVFSSGNFGIPFITTLHSDPAPIDLISRLTSPPMNVDFINIANLDVAIFMKQIGLDQRKVDSIFEFKWLSRGEIEHGDKIGENQFSLNPIFKDSNFSIRNSKVIDFYAQLKAISIDDAFKSFNKLVKITSDLSNIVNVRYNIEEWWLS